MIFLLFLFTKFQCIHTKHLSVLLCIRLLWYFVIYFSAFSLSLSLYIYIYVCMLQYFLVSIVVFWFWFFYIFCFFFCFLLLFPTPKSYSSLFSCEWRVSVCVRWLCSHNQMLTFVLMFYLLYGIHLGCITKLCLYTIFILFSKKVINFKGLSEGYFYTRHNFIFLTFCSKTKKKKKRNRKKRTQCLRFFIFIFVIVGIFCLCFYKL